jgi:hypothetical protein
MWRPSSGKPAGFVNKEFDLMCLDKLVSDPAALTRYSTVRIVEEGGSQGVEILNWIAMRGALAGQVAKVHWNYHSLYPIRPRDCLCCRTIFRPSRCARRGRGKKFRSAGARRAKFDVMRHVAHTATECRF